MPFEGLGRLLIVVGIILVGLGLLFLLVGSKLPALGHLPGDISIERDNVRIYIPLATMLLISVVLSLLLTAVLNLLSRR